MSNNVGYIVDDAKALVHSRVGLNFELFLPHSALLFDGNSIVEAEGLTWTLADSDLELTKERITFDCEATILTELSLFSVETRYKPWVSNVFKS